MAEVFVQDENGADVEVKQTPSYTEDSKTIHKESGMYSSMEEYLPEEKKEEDKDVESKPDDTSATKENVEEIVEEEKFPSLEEMEKPSLIEEIKKNQRLVSEKDTQFKEIETKFNDVSTRLENLKKEKSGVDPDVQAFFDGLKTDFMGTYSKFKDKFNLPDTQLVAPQFVNGGNASRLKQHIQTVIKPQVEKEFGFEEGEFKFDLSEAEEDPESASARFLTLKHDKEDLMRNEVTNIRNQEKVVSDAVKAQQEIDIQSFADTYLDGKLEDAQAIVTEMEQTALKVAKKELPLDKHPFSLGNILLGIKHEELTKVAVDKAVADLKDDLIKLGVSLPANELPTDLNNLKDKAVEKDITKPSSVGKNKFSPMLTSIESTII